LPGKPLLEIQGKPMIRRVWEQARLSSAERVVIATDDVRIFDVARGFGAQVCMTSPQHHSGTDRLQQVVTDLGLPADHIVVNVQGDEPLIPPEVIDQVASNLSNHQLAGIATLCEEVTTVADLTDPNVVKVVKNAHGMALYFSRAPIPWPRDAFAHGQGTMPQEGSWYRHIGIYAYRAGFLHQFVSWPAAPLEQLESLEQLRALYNGVGIHVDRAVRHVPGGVDTQEDLTRMQSMLLGNT
jgi:3-deoxy-manno-octulosonate cytidylyltransferase (CMP-KDO synthetase)